MCGIFGFTGDKNRSVLTQMGDALVHRGPDEFGCHETDKVSLGIRRLSIVDIESGQQPAASEDGLVTCVLNGEIYNHIELRDELVKEGHKFRSHHSDTEVIPHLYQKYGIDFTRHLNGMFAIALWDEKKSELHIVRDRSGIKPLFYTIQKGRLIFGSEIKAILANPLTEKKPNFQAITNYFSFKNIPSPESAFEGIFQLFPGERLVFKNGELEKFRWWKLKTSDPADMSFDEAAKGIKDILVDSVRLQLRSDAPFGAYLSGGIDSSAVVAIASGLVEKPLKTFTLIYDESLEGKNRDRDFARVISKRYGTDHHEDIMRPKEISEDLPQIVEAFDEPFSGTISTFFLTKFIAKHVTVALSGDGADELFGSYANHRLAQPLRNAEHFDRARPLDEFQKTLPAEFSAEKIMALSQIGDEAARRMRQYIFSDKEKSILLAPLVKKHRVENESEERIRNLYRSVQTTDPLNRALFVDQESLLPDQVLAFVDRLSMAHSVEVRPPFLDHRLVEYAATIPGKYKISGDGTVKHVLKKAVSEYLPNELIERPKEGFVMPVHLWLLDKLRPLLLDLLSKPVLEKQGLLNAEYVENLVSDHFASKADHGYKLWNLMMFQLWWNRHFQ